MKFVLGVIDEPTFKKEMERWKSDGGNKVIEELTAEYMKSIKK